MSLNRCSENVPCYPSRTARHSALYMYIYIYIYVQIPPPRSTKNAAICDAMDDRIHSMDTHAIAADFKADTMEARSQSLEGDIVTLKGTAKIWRSIAKGDEHGRPHWFTHCDSTFKKRFLYRHLQMAFQNSCLTSPGPKNLSLTDGRWTGDSRLRLGAASLAQQDEQQNVWRALSLLEICNFMKFARRRRTDRMLAYSWIGTRMCAKEEWHTMGQGLSRLYASSIKVKCIWTGRKEWPKSIENLAAVSAAMPRTTA